MRKFSANPGAMFGCVWQYRSLFWQLLVREISSRYRGSLFGFIWSFLNPALMLGVYTFVFGVVLPARWPQTGGNLTIADFSIILFAALIVHTLFSECVVRAPGLIVSNANLVKRVVFPLELLTWTSVGAALFQALVSILVLIAVILLIGHYVCWTVILLPIVLVPLILMSAGLSWFLAGLGVFVRDTSQAIGIISTTLLFMSPAFFPIEQTPAPLRPVIRANPLTLPMNQVRQVVIWGTVPDWSQLGLWFLVSLLVACVGFWWFQRTRSGFADVL